MNRPLFLLFNAFLMIQVGTQLKADESGVQQYYNNWKKRYLKPSVLVRGDYKIAFDGPGSTVSEAMGYGMLITVMMADVDLQAQKTFDGLDRFRMRYPSKINPAFMAWKIPPSEKKTINDSATDGDMDMAYALLVAARKWNEPRYRNEATVIINALSKTLIRPDCSLRLGDWDMNTKASEMIRTSDMMPLNFRAFAQATRDERWKGVEDRSYAILEELQRQFAPSTGLVPDFAIFKEGHWQPASPKALEGPHDGDYSYNACRVPWRVGWAALVLQDDRAVALLAPFMAWVKTEARNPENFKSGYHLNGKMLRGANFDSPAFITPTGVAAIAEGDQQWGDAVYAYGLKAHEGYYEDSINLLCLLVISGKTGGSGDHL